MVCMLVNNLPMKLFGRELNALHPEDQVLRMKLKRMIGLKEMIIRPAI